MYPTILPLIRMWYKIKFLWGIQLVWILSFPSPRLVDTPRLKNLICLCCILVVVQFELSRIHKESYCMKCSIFHTIQILYRLYIGGEAPILKVWKVYSHPFIVITHRFTLTLSGSHIYGPNKSVSKLLTLDRNMWNHITLCKLFVKKNSYLKL